MSTKSAFRNLTKAARNAHYFSESMRTAGYPSSPFADIYGQIADAIFDLLGEETETFDDSVTCASLLSFAITDDQCAEYLHRAYRKNLEEQN